MSSDYHQHFFSSLKVVSRRLKTWLLHGTQQAIRQMTNELRQELSYSSARIRVSPMGDAGEGEADG